ncbi:MAG: nucleotidyl transferase AbiEii/AbiGii toxin family protein, partial [Planctomycetota bacterium]
AEKLQAMGVLGSRKSRMRDFFDGFVLSHGMEFDLSTLARAIHATFIRRKTAIPENLRDPLLDSGKQSENKQRQCYAFLGKGVRAAVPRSLDAVVREIAVFADPVLQGGAATYRRSPGCVESRRTVAL